MGKGVEEPQKEEYGRGEEGRRGKKRWMGRWMKRDIDKQENWGRKGGLERG